MKTPKTEWGWDVVIPLIGSIAAIGYILYQAGMPFGLVATLCIVAALLIPYMFGQ